jgi:hypothetical protein
LRSQVSSHRIQHFHFIIDSQDYRFGHLDSFRTWVQQLSIGLLGISGSGIFGLGISRGDWFKNKK